ncbi:Predicted Zn-dependent peptidase [Spirosomataceae bacterium TFI 002]|nr:Predicted Zn-dependent peptidase [Spirosomataceae bacterium TFI 002]
MINYEHFQLANGLNVYLHKDKTTPIAAFNLIYNVGSRDEDEHKTGFAHLFEHLMFGGSKNIPSYDEPLQLVGGENNAFTSPDITNYYITLPAENIETAFWLESDRMMSLSFDPEVLEIQRKVVIEEFKQRYLNQPYGDVWLKLRPLAYEKHPYKWATIGKEISHIEDATMEDVKAFFFKFYRPNNANLVVAGDFEIEQIKDLAEKWFGPIPAGEKVEKSFPQEEEQLEARIMRTSAKVPLSAVYKAYKMPGRFEKDFHATDLLSDMLGRGKSSRLYTTLVKDQKLFNNISSYVTASLDTGLLVIQGNVNKGVSLEKANEAVDQIVAAFMNEKYDEKELEKVKNQSESTMLFSEVELLNRAMNLAMAANAGNAEWVNVDKDLVKNIEIKDIEKAAKTVLRANNSSTLLYEAAE